MPRAVSASLAVSACLAVSVCLAVSTAPFISMVTSLAVATSGAAWREGGALTKSLVERAQCRRRPPILLPREEHCTEDELPKAAGHQVKSELLLPLMADG